MAAKGSDVQADTNKQAQQSLQAIANSLEKEADDRVSKRNPVEKRWLEDLTQFHGKYDEGTATNLKRAKKSKLFINKTRPKTNVMESRLSDMLFPTDDRNWGIGPTPVPELTVEAETIAQEAAKAKVAAVAAPEDQQLQTEAQGADEILVAFTATMEEAKKRARSMEEEIDDHLRECKYSAQARDVILDACKLGTGIMKGPVTDGKHRSRWQQMKEAGSNVFGLTYEEDPRPAFWRVDPWNFFPDSDATSMEDNESVFERHLLNKKQLRKLVRGPGFNKAAARRILQLKPRGTIPSYLPDLRSITGAYNEVLRDRYHVWEYHGPLTAEQIQDLSIAMGEQQKMEDVEELDPLEEVQAVVWFCQGEVLKFGLHHLDSGDSIYSCFNLEKDEASIFGFGIPYIMRDPQSALTGAWRILMDNMGLSSGPQVVINEDVVEPQDGEWVLKGGKIWIRKKAAPPDKAPFETYDIPSNMDELLKVIEVANQNIDDETALPMMAQGEQGSQVTKTAHGMSILMNSINVVFRRIIKNWDDDMTVPNLQRMYDWLMQFSKKEHIKGDYQVDARGTSVLLVREMQSANLLTFLQLFSGHPILGKYLKEEGLPAMRALAKTMMVPADEVIKSDPEIAEDEAKAADEPPPPDPEMEKIAASLNLQQMKGEHERELALIHRETELIKLAQQGNLTMEELGAKLQMKREEIESAERKMQAEAGVTAREGPSGGGHF